MTCIEEFPDLLVLCDLAGARLCSANFHPISIARVGKWGWLGLLTLCIATVGRVSRKMLDRFEYRFSQRLIVAYRDRIFFVHFSGIL